MNKILTKEIAEQFLGDPDGVELDEFTSIEAEVLSKHQGELCLIECRFISTSAIELLSRRTGSLILGLETLSDSLEIQRQDKRYESEKVDRIFKEQ